MDDLKFLVIDIETIPCQTLPEGCIPTFDEASVATGNLKDPFKIREKIDEAHNKFNADIDKKLSVDPDYCQVCCFGYGDANDQTVFIASENLGEFELISEAWEIIASHYNKKIPIVSFNGISFDLPILLRRAMLLDISVPPGMVQKLISRFEYGNHFDLMQLLACRNPFSGKLEAKSLSFYLNLFGLGYKTNGMDGSQVYPAFKEGRYSDIMNYCKDDVRLTAALFKRVAPWIMTPVKKEEK
jgi:uncharacterized protein YprB with RNaseH-like and TPR domain